MRYFLSTPVAYLVGSIPFAYLAGRLFAKKDLRLVGSGNLGTSNVYREVGRLAGVAVFFADCAKMALTLLIFRLLGFSEWGLSLAALAVIAGHNWSVFTRFRGGRGMLVTLVGAAFLLPLETLIVLGVLTVGGAVSMMAPACAIALVAWPLLALWQHRPTPLIVFAVVASVMGFARRLQGSPAVVSCRGMKPPWKSLLWNRLVHDREAPLPPGPGAETGPHEAGARVSSHDRGELGDE